MRRTFTMFLFALLCADFVWATDRPNIVLIFSDDQGVNDVGCYGSEIPTPNIDLIAKQGIRLTNWYSASSICTPSRFGLLTGRNPSRSQDQLLSALIFLTDHGGDPVYGGSNRPLRGVKATLFEGGLKVPCVMKWPQEIKAGSESDAVLSSLDLFPTFCELADAALPTVKLDGVSIAPRRIVRCTGLPSPSWPAPRCA